VPRKRQFSIFRKGPLLERSCDMCWRKLHALCRSIQAWCRNPQRATPCCRWWRRPLGEMLLQVDIAYRGKYKSTSSCQFISNAIKSLVVQW